MDPRNCDPSRGSGRGRPMESDLRRPYAMNTFDPDQEYVPTEGSSGNGLRLQTNFLPEHQFVMPVPIAMLYPDNTANHTVNDHVSGRNNHLNICDAVGSNIRVNAQSKSVLSPHAKEFFPRNFQPEPRNISVPATTINTYNDSYPIQELRQFMFEVTMNPGVFDFKLQNLMDCLTEHVSDIDDSRGVLNTVFEESVRQANFRYNGARLSKSLWNELNIDDDKISFKQLLINRCNQEHNRREQLVTADDGGEYLRGFAMYMAELFSQLEIRGQRILFFGDHLYSIMNTLVSHPSSDNLKCICQILKLVGAYLEDVEKNKSTSNKSAPDMEKLIDSLKTITDLNELPRDICAMVSNVVDLHASDWGRSQESTESVNDQTIPPPELDEPVMYGPDGQPMSAEESLFLHSHLSHHSSDVDDYEGYEENPQDDFTDDEVQEAYNMFLNDLAHKMSPH